MSLKLYVPFLTFRLATSLVAAGAVLFIVLRAAT